MTDDDKNALKEFLSGVAFTVGVVVIIAIGVAIMTGGMPDKEQSTQVVGTYKECDIIQWSYGSLAEYKYFLYCEPK